MTYAPQTLLDLREYLKPLTGLPNNALGIIGDENHNGGYHHGWDERRIVNGNTADYSWNESPRDNGHRSDAAAALDIGLFSRLRELSVWLVAQCEANTADTQDIRSIIYSPDGIVVRRWDRLKRRDTGDSSHLTHTHVSFFRDAEGRTKIPVFERFFEGGKMANGYEMNANNHGWALTQMLPRYDVQPGNNAEVPPVQVDNLLAVAINKLLEVQQPCQPVTAQQLKEAFLDPQVQEALKVTVVAALREVDWTTRVE